MLRYDQGNFGASVFDCFMDGLLVWNRFVVGVVEDFLDLGASFENKS